MTATLFNGTVTCNWWFIGISQEKVLIYLAKHNVELRYYRTNHLPMRLLNSDFIDCEENMDETLRMKTFN